MGLGAGHRADIVDVESSGLEEMAEGQWRSEHPGGSAVKTLCCSAGGSGSIPDHRTKILHAVKESQLKKKKWLRSITFWITMSYQRPTGTEDKF